MIRNIVFDMGNVIVRFDPVYFLDRACITDPDDRRLILNELFLSVEWAQMDEGTLDEKGAEPMILERFPARLWDTVRTLLYEWAYPCDTVPGMEELVRRLKSAGYGIYLLSNASRAQHEYWPRYEISRCFDGKLISCDVKIVKPCRKIYKLFTQRFGLKPEECLFIDDSHANVAGAVACGWQGIVFHGSSQELERKLSDAGIKV